MWKALTNFVKELPFPLLVRLYYAYHRLIYLPRFAGVRRRLRIPALSTLDLSKHKRCDTLFILGSGPSINRISAERWQAIARADTLGFNLWLIHPFVPSLYFFEGTPWEDRFCAAYLRLATERAAEYAGVPKVCMEVVFPGRSYIAELPEGWRKNLYAVPYIPAFSRDDGEFNRMLAYLIEDGAFTSETRIHRLLKHCGSLSTMVTLGVKMGYRRIVLCGIDLTAQDYFYQDAGLYPAWKDMDFYAGTAFRAKSHATMTRYAWGNTPIDVVLLEMKRQVLDPRGIELYVESRSSALWPRIPQAPDGLFEEIAANSEEASCPVR